MNRKRLELALRNIVLQIDPGNTKRVTPEAMADYRELIVVLQNVVRGEPLDKAFGSPSSWGSTAIGEALRTGAEPDDLFAMERDTMNFV